MNPPARALLLTALLAGLWPAAAAACPFCDGGAPVRAEVFGPGFWPAAGAVAAPVAAVLGAAVLLGRPARPTEGEPCPARPTAAR